MLIGEGAADRLLSEDRVADLVGQAVSGWSLSRRKVLVIIPDATRTAPMPLMFQQVCRNLVGTAKKVDFLVALGTHQPLSEEALNRLVGLPPGESARRSAGVGLYNHRWDLPETFRAIGVIGEEEMEALTGGLLRRSVPVSLNGMVFDYDHIIICGPVFPHEVAGFSGGNKYFFPGIGGSEVINFTHWLGALITSREVIGVKHTPVRAVIDRAASLIEVPRTVLAFVTPAPEMAGEPGVLSGLYAGEAKEAWSAAADLSAQVHITWVERPFQRVLAIMPRMYDDLWTAAKGMYKMEPAMADGGEVVIYAPHITEVSYTHGKLIDLIGYHVRDYFVKQWDRFGHLPGGVLAHSTHLRGSGSYEDGVETPRVQVTLATGIPEERCRRLNLGYMDPRTVDIAAWEGREAEGVKVIHKAGETLFRIAA